MKHRIAPITKKTVVSLVVILVILPASVLATALLADAQVDLRTMLFAAGVLATVATLMLGALRRRSVSFDGHTLEVKAAFYTRRTPIGDLDLDGARIVDLDERTELRPILRMNGYSLPGFHAGHYRLRSMQKAFALLTARRRVLAVPERSGTLLLLSIERPQPLLDALRSSDLRLMAGEARSRQLHQR